jgi:hypothetical protein
MNRAESVYIVVRCASNTYQAAASGVRASSTSGARFAAERLGEKLFGEGFAGATQLPAAVGDDHNVTRWRLTGSKA